MSLDQGWYQTGREGELRTLIEKIPIKDHEEIHDVFTDVCERDKRLAKRQTIYVYCKTSSRSHDYGGYRSGNGDQQTTCATTYCERN